MTHEEVTAEAKRILRERCYGLTREEIADLCIALVEKIVGESSEEFEVGYRQQGSGA